MAKGMPENLNLAIFSTLQDLLIVELAKSGAPQREIRKLLGVDIGRVNGVARLLNRKTTRGGDDNGE
jgi:hypothetical protein